MKISVVVVEYHSLEELKKCTETIQTAFSWEVEIIASSNSCYPPTEQERIKKEYNQFVWSFNDLLLLKLLILMGYCKIHAEVM